MTYPVGRDLGEDLWKGGSKGKGPRVKGVSNNVGVVGEGSQAPHLWAVDLVAHDLIPFSSPPYADPAAVISSHTMHICPCLGYISLGWLKMDPTTSKS